MNLYSLHLFSTHYIFVILLIIALLFCAANLADFIIQKLHREFSTPQNLSLYENIFKTVPRLIAILVNLFFVVLTLFMNTHFVLQFDDNDLRLMPKGEYYYFVEATSNNHKTYTLEAKVEKINKKYYNVQNVYFNNGGYLYFTNSEPCTFTDKQNLISQDGKEWTIKLTSQKVKTPHGTEHTEFGISPIILYASTSCFTLNLLYYLATRRQKPI